MGRLRYSRLNDSLLAGPMPHTEAHVQALRDEGVVVVVNLCEEREYWDGERETVTSAYEAAGIRELHLPVKDGSTVPHGVIDAAVEGMQQGVVYVHCRGGRERSATVATALLAAREGMPIERALELAQSGRPVFKPLPWQLEGLHAWAARTA
jgi:atypical dual specificity phosphatase